mmetsp:Transcript_10173/g.27899  ORF Transcript_10173/g.27899 Transcript_10173/m.27899 type:complete len:171 (-) Transcript_10173:673-1185(-)
MGRRAKKAPVQTKKRATLAKRFKCPFCSNENAVECKMDFKAGTGALSCRLCGASYQMPIHHLHEPVDVFSEWLDDCEAAAQGKPTGGDINPSSSSNGGGSGGGALSSRYDDDDELPQSSGLGGGGGTGSNKRSRDGGEEARTKSTKKKSKSSSKNFAAVGLDDSDDSDDE